MTREHSRASIWAAIISAVVLLSLGALALLGMWRDDKPEPSAETTRSATTPQRWDVRTTCDRAVPVVEQANTLMREYAAASSPTALSQERYARTWSDLRGLVQQAAAELRTDLTVVEEEIGAIVRQLERGGSVTANSGGRFTSASTAIYLACDAARA